MPTFSGGCRPWSALTPACAIIHAWRGSTSRIGLGRHGCRRSRSSPHQNPALVGADLGRHGCLHARTSTHQNPALVGADLGRHGCLRPRTSTHQNPALVGADLGRHGCLHARSSTHQNPALVGADLGRHGCLHARSSTHGVYLLHAWALVGTDACARVHPRMAWISISWLPHPGPGPTPGPAARCPHGSGQGAHRPVAEARVSPRGRRPPAVAAAHARSRCAGARCR